jgi:hypothetical protein
MPGIAGIVDFLSVLSQWLVVHRPELRDGSGVHETAIRWATHAFLGSWPRAAREANAWAQFMVGFTKVDGEYPSLLRAAAGEHSFGRGWATPPGKGRLRGIKKNVIMGRLIPAGTGLPAYKKLQVVIDEKSPTYEPPTFARAQPADLVAVGHE